MIQMRDICVSFRSERQEKIFGVSRTQVLFDVSLSIPKGSCLGILGESGSGKSTLGRVICGLLKPDSGEYLLEGKNVYASRDGKKNLQNMLSVVFQDYTTSANPRFRIRDILAEGIRVKERKSGKKRTGARNTADFWSWSVWMRRFSTVFRMSFRVDSFSVSASPAPWRVSRSSSCLMRRSHPSTRTRRCR